MVNEYSMHSMSSRENKSEWIGKNKIEYENSGSWNVHIKEFWGILNLANKQSTPQHTL